MLHSCCTRAFGAASPFGVRGACSSRLNTCAPACLPAPPPSGQLLVRESRDGLQRASVVNGTLRCAGELAGGRHLTLRSGALLGSAPRDLVAVHANATLRAPLRVRGDVEWLSNGSRRSWITNGTGRALLRRRVEVRGPGPEPHTPHCAPYAQLHTWHRVGPNSGLWRSGRGGLAAKKLGQLVRFGPTLCTSPRSFGRALAHLARRVGRSARRTPTASGCGSTWRAPAPRPCWWDWAWGRASAAGRRRDSRRCA